MLALSTYQNANITNNIVYRYKNIGRAMIAGVELEGRHSSFDDRLTLSYVGAYNYG